MKKPKAILFDWDNTLADTWPTIHEAMTKTFEHFELKAWTLEETKERVHRSLRDSFPDVFGEDWERAGKFYLSYFESVHLERLKVLEGAEEMLAALQKKKIYTAVVSNKTGHNLRKEIEHLGWNKYFSKTIGAKDAAKDKPSPEPVLMALQGSSIEPSPDVWFVGDSLTDLECAYNTKCKPVFYGDQDYRHERFSHCQPELYFPDHKSLKAAIDLF